MMRMALVFVALLLWVGDARAVEWVRQELTQGGFVVGRAAPGEKVKLEDGTPVEVAPDGLFVVGFDRAASSTQVLEVCGTGCEKVSLSLRQRTYRVQNVVGVPGKTVNPDRAQEKVIAADNRAIRAARAVAGDGEAFAGAFTKPVSGTASGFYGSRRTYNGEERSWHKGYDLAAPRGTPIFAPADGVVTLARDTFMTGNLVMLEHGHGFSTLYAHMHALEVKVGQRVRQGERIGAVDTTGRSTGPHLHWGLYWRQGALDPALLLEHNADTKGF